MSWLPAMMFMHMLNDDELDQPKQADESDDTPHSLTHNNPHIPTYIKGGCDAPSQQAFQRLLQPR